MFRRVRIAILLFILASVANSAWREKIKVNGWQSTLHVAIFPINGDGTDATRHYVEDLDERSFAQIGEYLERQGQRYGVRLLRPVRVSLGPQMTVLPPRAPDSNSGILQFMGWSLTMRYWAWRNTPAVTIDPDVRLYLLYFDPSRFTAVPHSVGLKKGRIGVVNLFATAEMDGSNQVVTTHELLHTLGATDKYDPGSNAPRYPEGYAEPNRSPRLPQLRAEIMAGRIPLTPTRAEIPESLDDTLVGPRTAAEIGWDRH